ncbi:MAG: precorrin-6A reductase [Nitrospinae bacterium]|nr:precorrin-6A reductase [Nitrospinota bacterium]
MKVLLLGGASETMPLAMALATRGLEVIASTATDNELDVGGHPKIKRRIGRLTAEEMAAFIREEGIGAVLDATHPFAVEAQKNAMSAANTAGLPYLRFERPGLTMDYERVHWADDHEEAAQIAFSFGKAALLTTGSRNLAPYVRQSVETGVPLVARVLPHPESEEACRKNGLDFSSVIFARGPFSVEENLETINKYSIGVMVTKESGQAGGVMEKVESCRLSGIPLVVVRRPREEAGDSFADMEKITQAVMVIAGGNGANG